MRAVWLGVLATVLVSGPATAGDGVKFYQRCAACHLPTGEGVPSSYPPLLDHIGDVVATDQGRAYVVAVITKGLMGPIEVKGEPYRGMMPAQGYGLSDSDLADLLNYAVAAFGGDAPPFTGDEVAALRKQAASLNARDVLALRPANISNEEEK